MSSFFDDDGMEPVHHGNNYSQDFPDDETDLDELTHSSRGWTQFQHDDSDDDTTGPTIAHQYLDKLRQSVSSTSIPKQKNDSIKSLSNEEFFKVTDDAENQADDEESEITTQDRPPSHRRSPNLHKSAAFSASDTDTFRSDELLEPTRHFSTTTNIFKHPHGASDQDGDSDATIDEDIHQSLTNPLIASTTAPFFGEPAATNLLDDDQLSWTGGRTVQTGRTDATLATDVLLKGFEETSNADTDCATPVPFGSHTQNNRRPINGHGEHMSNNNYHGLKGSALKEQFKDNMEQRASAKKLSIDDVQYSKARADDFFEATVQTSTMPYVQETTLHNNDSADFVKRPTTSLHDYSNITTPSHKNRPISALHTTTAKPTTPNYPKNIILSKTFTKQAWSANPYLKNVHYQEPYQTASLHTMQVRPIDTKASAWKDHGPDTASAQYLNKENSFFDHNPLQHTLHPSSTVKQYRPTTATAINKKIAQNIRVHNPFTFTNITHNSRPSDLMVEGFKTASKGGIAPYNDSSRSKTSSKASSNESFVKKKSAHQPTYIDELLFGMPSPNTTLSCAPSVETRAGKQLGATTLQSETKRMSSSKIRATRPSKDVPTFKNTYVDETLFGCPPEEPSFRAPWESRNKKTPYVFDATDYKALEQRKLRSEGEQASKKPAWK